ncbi:MAG: hypothetical protein U1G08_03965 [Verrucomicrobiota bacterium]
MKLSLAAALVAAAAIVSLAANNSPTTPAPAAPAPQEHGASCHAGHVGHSDKASGSEIGSPKDLSNRSAVTQGSPQNGHGHCSMMTMNSGQAKKSCCQ